MPIPSLKIEWGLIEVRPIKGKVISHSERPRDRYVEDWELVEALRVANKTLRAYIVLKLLTGLRRATRLSGKAYFLLSLPASADTLTGKVVKITGGDTIYVLTNYKEHKIRLAGIDAPERKQAYGLVSRKHLVSIVAGQQVTVEYLRPRIPPSFPPKLRYERIRNT